MMWTIGYCFQDLSCDFWQVYDTHEFPFGKGVYLRNRHNAITAALKFIVFTNLLSCSSTQ